MEQKNLAAEARQSLRDVTEYSIKNEQERKLRILEIVAEARSQMLADTDLKNIEICHFTYNSSWSLRLPTIEDNKYFIQLNNPGREPVYSHINYDSSVWTSSTDKYGNPFDEIERFDKKRFIFGGGAS